MADKKITQLTNITGANLVDADEFVVVDISADETKAITLGELKEAFDSGSGFVRITGDTMTGDLALSGADVTFGNNDKATFGASLQVYHDGSNNYVDAAGVGHLYLQSQGDDKDVKILSDDGFGGLTEYFRADGSVGKAQMFYYGTKTLETTSTGIDVTGTVTMDGGSTSGDFTFGDNDKAIFGDGSDLQVYHYDNNSYIDEVGAGVLKVRSNGTGIDFESTGGETLAQFGTNAAVTLYHNNAAKLATTTTGIDVTGEITADGLTVDGDASISSSNARLRLFETDTTDLNTQLQNSGGDFFLKTLADDAGSSTTRLSIDHATGDISFYDSAGSSQSFFWDAADERLGLGSTTPTSTLTVNGQADFQKSGTTLLSIEGGATNAIIGAKNSRQLKLQTASTNRFNIDDNGDISFYESTGNTPKFHWSAADESLGIGTTTPEVQLETFGAAQTYNFSAGTDTLANFAIINDNVNSGTGPAIVLGSTYLGSATVANARIFAERQSTGSTNAGATDLIFEVGQAAGSALAERMRIDSSGHAIIPAGVTLGTSAGVYNAANTLDDYEEGTFIPTFSGTTSGTVTLGTFNRLGYTKVGRKVTITGRVDVSGDPTLVGNLNFGNLPFATGNLDQQGAYSVQYMFITIGSSVTGNPVIFELTENTTNGTVRTEAWDSAAGILVNNSRIQMSITYFAA